jgi:hypothetical protein
LNQEIIVDTTQWHIYGIEISDSGVTFKIDGSIVGSTSTKLTPTVLRMPIWIDNARASWTSPWTFLNASINQALYIDYVNYFVDGAFSTWTGTLVDSTTSNITVASDDKHHGSFSAKADTGSIATSRYALAYQIFSNLSTAYARTYVKFNSLDSVDNHTAGVILLSALATYYSVAMGGVRCVNGTWRWHLQYLSAGTTKSDDDSMSSSVETGVWYCLEIKTLIGQTDGEARLYVDDVETIVKTGLDNNAYGNPNILIIGKQSFANYPLCTPGYLWVDCVSVSDAKIGLEAPETIEPAELLSGGGISTSTPSTLFTPLPPTGLTGKPSTIPVIYYFVAATFLLLMFLGFMVFKPKHARHSRTHKTRSHKCR